MSRNTVPAINNTSEASVANGMLRTQFLGFAAVGALVVLAVASIPTVASIPISADEPAQSLGPVGPTQPILATVGSKRVVAFYLRNGGQCDVQAVMWEGKDTAADSAARFRVSLKPRQVMHLDSVENASLSLQCGHSARTLTIIQTTESVEAGTGE
jgi:hypothetical protein